MNAIQRFFRHIKEGFMNMIRNIAMTVSSASAVTITLLLVGSFFILTTNITSITSNIKDSFTILVKIDREISNDDIKKLESKVTDVAGVKSVTYSNKEDELDKQIEMYPKQADYYRRHKGENNPLFDVFVVEVDDADSLSQISEQIRNLKGVYSAEQGGEGTEKLIDSLNTMQKVGLILVVVLTVLAVYLISNTIKVTIMARKEEIGIMRTVGASNGFIRAPYVVEGALIGLLGSIIPILVLGFGYKYLYDLTGGVLLSKLFTLADPNPFIYQMSGALALTGISVGLIGSFISVSKYLRWKR